MGKSRNYCRRLLYGYKLKELKEKYQNSSLEITAVDCSTATQKKFFKFFIFVVGSRNYCRRLLYGYMIKVILNRNISSRLEITAVDCSTATRVRRDSKKGIEKCLEITAVDCSTAT